ncbi:hypothetical protein SAMN04487891_11818 [Flagellimonas taeanensis]|uniref:Immunity protein 26 n=1 Tax=Flagellimonas taeanensis TaxID=1005926 RepID=A0A1M7CU95_9FLAO|nr:hypothetical protein [Allomuricauda taeanensis]SFC66120.1 hypothetical protein SAMN04487891_11818 [Allomuricauda taeanensis]SHL70663.1 hypothetical protein SAMN05216293_4112 [Allomuricauda taeanensis]
MKEDKSDIEIFRVGDIVTYKTHPMFENRRIKGDTKLIPPIMVVISVNSNEHEAINTKYDCIYFDDDRCEFNVVLLKHFMLRTFEDLLYEKINNKGMIIEDYTTLIEKVKNYPPVKYELGSAVSFKTKKLEIYKKRTSKSIEIDPESGKINEIKEVLNYVVSFASPDFILCQEFNQYPKGLIMNKPNNSYISKELFKVKWYNVAKKKFSEQILPSECFVDQFYLNDD